MENGVEKAHVRRVSVQAEAARSRVEKEVERVAERELLSQPKAR